MKTACEEAAAYFQINVDLATRLRAEGRKIKRYEAIILGIYEYGMSPEGTYKALEREAARIQKARKK